MQHTSISISSRVSALTRAPHVLAAVLAAVLMSACGGGGGSSGGGAVTSASTFNVRSGYQAHISAGGTDNYNVSGTCSGTAQIVNGAVAPTTFEGAAALGATQTATVNFAPNSCQPSVSTASGTNYYDSNYALIGSVVNGVEYATVMSGTTPVPLPSGAKVGDSGALTSLTTYQDASKTPPPTGSRTVTYAVGADTATTAILDIIVNTYNASNVLQVTQTSRYRVAADGSLTVLSIDVLYSNAAGGAHLVYTKV